MAKPEELDFMKLFEDQKAIAPPPPPQKKGILGSLFEKKKESPEPAPKPTVKK